MNKILILISAASLILGGCFMNKRVTKNLSAISSHNLQAAIPIVLFGRHNHQNAFMIFGHHYNNPSLKCAWIINTRSANALKKYVLFSVADNGTIKASATPIREDDPSIYALVAPEKCNNHELYIKVPILFTEIDGSTVTQECAIPITLTYSEKEKHFIALFGNLHLIVQMDQLFHRSEPTLPLFEPANLLRTPIKTI
ncbi:MAG: hypothetical protein QG604_376 [Candidatus Dependentiae bacterium]|nr:hypothetical protein [Candidatus Dependentiae bacterium]